MSIIDREAALAAFLGHCHQRDYPARAAIIRQGDTARDLHYIVSGTVTVLLEDERGREIVLAYLEAGEFFGELALFTEGASRTALVRARNDCRIAQIGYERLKSLGDLYASLVFLMTAQLSRRLRDTSYKLGDLAFMDVYGRVARTLLDLAGQQESETVPDGRAFTTTRQEIARVVGCSREMVGKVLKDMEDQGLIATDGRRIVVLDSGAGQLGGT